MQTISARVKQVIADLLADMGYPVYNNYVPVHENGEAYILITDVASADDSSKTHPATETTIRINVYTRQNLARDDSLCDAITAGVYQRIYPHNFAKLDLSPDFSNTAIHFVNETPQMLIFNSFISINKFITFRLHIFQH